MSDGLAVGTVGGALRIDMDPLVIARRVGKLVDALLVDGNPFGMTEIGALRRKQCGRVVENHWHGALRGSLAARTIPSVRYVASAHSALPLQRTAPFHFSAQRCNWNSAYRGASGP